MNFFTPDFIEPNICFTTREMKIGEDYPLEKLPVEELIKEDQVLLDFGDQEESGEGNLRRRPVVPGANTYWSEDKNQVLSKTSGYPKLRFFADQQEGGELQVLEVSVTPLFHLSPDRMTASIVIEPLLFNYRLISSEDVYQFLTRAGIVHGIEYKQLNLVKEVVRKGVTDSERIVVARGRDTVGGTDARVRFEMEIGPIAGQLFEDGSIDFRERKIMVPVTEGQVIATRIPPTDGRAGITVLGERIPARPGKDIRITTTGDAEYYPEKKQVLALANGVLSIVKGSTIKVSTKQEIHGDINYTTGNIESRNSILVHGSVLPGFQLRADGDLEIRGSVTGTQVSSMSNIVVKGGIMGTKSSVKARGDVDILFIEQGHIHCEGNCVIRKQCYYSYVFAGGNIRCSEVSTVVGGELIAEGCISVGDAGSQDAKAMLLAAGVVAERFYRARELQLQLKDHKESIIQRLKGYTGSARAKKLKSLKVGIEEMKRRQMRINLIPGTGLYSRQPREDDSDPTRQGGSACHSNGSNGTDISAISIDVHGTIFGGTMLQIGNRTLTLEDTVSRRRFILDETKHHIVSIPLR